MKSNVHRSLKIGFGLWLLFGIIVPSFAQFPKSQNQSFGNTTGNNNNPFQRDSTQSEAYLEERDTFGIFYFLVATPNQLVPLADTTLRNFHIVDPLREGAVDKISTGILGAAYKNLWYETPFRTGFHVGLNQFDDYYILPEHLKYNVLKTPFTNLFYSRGPTQSDSYFKAHFARNFANGFRVILDNKSIKQFGTTSQYPNQQLENNALGVGGWWDAPSDKYDGFLSYTINSTRAQENGGVLDFPNDTNDGTPGGNRAQTAVVLLNDSTLTRHAHQAVSYAQYWKFKPQSDSATTHDSRDFTVYHRIAYLNSTYKHFDQQRGDTALVRFYKNLLTDERGLRYFTRIQTIKNEFSLSTYRNRSDTLSTNQERDRIEIALNHALYMIDQEAKDTLLNNLLLVGKINFRLKDKFDLKTYAHLSLLDNAGDFRIQGDLLFDIGKIGQLSANFVNQAYSPTLLEHELYISQKLVWRNDFKKTITTSLTGSYTLPWLKLSVSGGYHLINNLLYFDEDNTPKQLEEPINLVQFLAQHRLQLWKIYFENTLALQATTQNIIRTPSWFSKHTLYLEASLFKKALDFQLGTTLKMNESYLGYYYLPITGQFQLDNTNNIPFYPLWDAYFSIKVKTVRFFIRAENVTNLINKSQYYIQIANYPYPIFYTRLGLDWRFFN